MNPLRIFGDMCDAERDRWALWTPVLLGAGIACYFALPYEPPLAALVAMPLLALLAYPLYIAQPDVFVGSDGKEWAARLDDGRLAVSNIDHDAFTTQQWQERLGKPEMVDAGDLPADFDQLRCDGAGCVYKKAGHVLAFPSIDAAALEDCARADVVVASFDISDCGKAAVIDDPELWRHGAHTIYFSSGGMRIRSVREKRGERPWSVGWK